MKMFCAASARSRPASPSRSNAAGLFEQRAYHACATRK